MYVQSDVIRRFYFFFNDTATTEIYTLSLHDALPISPAGTTASSGSTPSRGTAPSAASPSTQLDLMSLHTGRSEEHTSELQSRQYLVCRLLLEKKKKHLARHLVYAQHDTDSSDHVSTS